MLSNPSLLLVDSGNSRIKWVEAEVKSKVAHCGDVTSSDMDAGETRLLEQWRCLKPPMAVWLSNSAGTARQQQLEQWVMLLWGQKPHCVSTMDRYQGLVNGYDQPQQLGVDRWLGLLALYLRGLQPFILIDCGTATTLDRVDQNGVHQGGVILPAIDSNFETLMARAPHLQVELNKKPSTLLGHTTAEGLRGCEKGVVNYLEQLIKQLQDQYGVCQIILTGGSAERLVAGGVRYDLQIQALIFEGVLAVASEGDFRGSLALR